MKARHPGPNAARARSRVQANAYGQRAEWAAALLLMLKGYRVLERNYRVRGGEIDLVMRRGATVVFVEVKARPRLDDALEAITPRKRQRINRAARVWLTRHPAAARSVLRGDGVFLAPWRWPRHIENAFPLDLI